MLLQLYRLPIRIPKLIQNNLTCDIEFRVSRLATNHACGTSYVCMILVNSCLQYTNIFKFTATRILTRSRSPRTTSGVNEPYAVFKYLLRRGVGLIHFFENGTRPQTPTSPPAPHQELRLRICSIFTGTVQEKQFSESFLLLCGREVLLLTNPIETVLFCATVTVMAESKQTKDRVTVSLTGRCVYV